MKTILFIEDNDERSFFWNMFDKFFHGEKQTTDDHENVINIVDNYKPDFVYLNLKEPVNGEEDLMDRLRYSDDFNRLRVTIIKINLLSGFIDKILLAEKFIQSIFSSGKEEVVLKK